MAAINFGTDSSILKDVDTYLGDPKVDCWHIMNLTSWWLNQPHLKTMQPSNWIMKPQGSG